MITHRKHMLPTQRNRRNFVQAFDQFDTRAFVNLHLFGTLLLQIKQNIRAGNSQNERTFCGY